MGKVGMEGKGAAKTKLKRFLRPFSLNPVPCAT